MDWGSNIFRSFDFGKRTRTFKLNSFVGLYLTNTLADSHENLSNLHPFLIRSSRGNSRRNKPRISGFLRNSQFSHLICARVYAVMPPTYETQLRTPWQITWQRTPLKFAGKVILRNWEHKVKRNSKFIKRSRRKSAKSKLGKKKKRNLDLFGSGSLATFLFLAI